MKISKRAREKFTFYLDIPDTIGWGDCEPAIDDPQGCSAIEAWHAKETCGKILPCREPEILSKAIRGKKSLNLQIEHWAEGIFDGGKHKIFLSLFGQSEIFDYSLKYPRWVFRAVIEQAGKLATHAIGFAPRFTRFETFRGNWWPPEMDSFDPKI